MISQIRATKDYMNIMWTADITYIFISQKIISILLLWKTQGAKRIRLLQ